MRAEFELFLNELSGLTRKHRFIISGCGAMTVAMLMKNCVQAAKIR